MKTIDYVEALRAKAKRPSVYAVAQMLEMNEDTVRSWALGRARPNNDACYRIAEVLDLPVLQVIADVEAERATNAAERLKWESRARKSAASVLVAFCTAIGSLQGRPLYAAGTGAIDTVEVNALQIMRALRALRRFELWLRGIIARHELREVG